MGLGTRRFLNISEQILFLNSPRKRKTKFLAFLKMNTSLWHHMSTLTMPTFYGFNIYLALSVLSSFNCLLRRLSLGPMTCRSHTNHFERHTVEIKKQCMGYKSKYFLFMGTCVLGFDNIYFIWQTSWACVALAVYKISIVALRAIQVEFSTAPQNVNTM